MQTKLFQLVLAAIAVCGLSVFTSCSDDKDSVSDILPEKIIGKWILAETNDNPTPTNHKYVITFASPTKGYLSASLNAYAEISSFWGDRQDVDVAISGDMVKNTMVINEHLTVVDDMKVTSITDSDTWGGLKVSWIVDGTVIKTAEESIRTVKVTADYSAAIVGLWECQGITGGETNNDANARLEFLADGSYNFYRKDDGGQWQAVTTREFQNYFVDGTLLATRWKNQGEEIAYEWWEISTVSGGQMQWNALRQNVDGSTFQQSVKWTKVN